MKKKLLPLAVLTAATLCATTAIAGNKAESLSLSPFIGGLHFDGVTHLDPAMMYGLKLGYNFTDRIGMEGVVEAGKPTTSRNDGINFLNYRLEGLYHFIPKKDLVPYLAAGYGGMRYKSDYTGENAKGGLFAYGAGVKYFITDMFAIRGDVRHMLVNRGPDAYEYTLGALINLSEAAPLPKPVEPPPVAKVVEPAPAPVPPPEPKPVPAPPVVKPAPVPGPTASISALPPSIESGDSATLNWSSQNSTECAITPAVGPVQPSGTMIVAPADSTVYTLSCSGAGGSAQSIARVSVTPKPVVPQVVDSDMDGVPDSLDKCPDTPAGTKVDKNGCPPVSCKEFTLEIEFATGKADIKPAFHKEIKKVADFLKENPGSTVSIEGHTDNVGGESMNMKLSQRRADSVRSYLIKKFGVAADHVTAKGFGETKPRATNKTAQGRHENRRVEALVLCGGKTIKATDHDTHR